MRADRSRNGLAACRQRGVALLTAMIIVTLVATLAASMLWQQWRSVQVESAERARSQSAWILSGALDWARLILKEDARNGATKLGEPWATPLMEARLSTFLASDKVSTDDATEAFLAGSISDAQGRFNLKNLVAGGKVDQDAVAALKRLCEVIGASTDAADRIAAGLASAIGGGAKDAESRAPLLPATVAQLAWLGVDPDALRALGPYVVLLPVPTPVNVNTASREVLVAAVKDLDLASAQRLIQRRPFNTVAQAQLEIPTIPLANKVDVRSSYFEVRGRFRLGDRVLEQISLVQRPSKGVPTVLRRENVASRDQPGT
ncbi:MAG: type II secretion system minor pseudopilin GspK [Caldimonas sp.]